MTKPMFSAHNLLSGCLNGEISPQGTILGFFTLGLAGSVTHCVPMCGSFVIARSNDMDSKTRAFLVPYHLGRITTYIGMAVLLSTILNTAFLFLPVRNIIVFAMLSLAGVIFLVNAFPALKSVFPWAASIRLPVGDRFIMAGLRKLQSLPHFLKEYSQGLLMGFIPCGLVMAALLATSATQNVAHAAMAMAAFGFGTMPALMAVSFSHYGLKNKFPQTAKNLNPIFMVGSAIWLFVLAGLTLI